MFTYDYIESDKLRTLGFKRIGKNVRIHETACVVGIECIEIGNDVRIDGFTTIVAGNFIRIGCHVHIANYCMLSGGEGIELADYVNLSGGVKIYTRSDDYSGKYMTNPTVPEEYTGVTKGSVRLEQHVIVGAGSVLLPGVVLGEGAAVGALSMVNRSLPGWEIYGGVPARRIAARKRNLLKWAEQLETERERER